MVKYLITILMMLSVELSFSQVTRERDVSTKVLFSSSESSFEVQTSPSPMGGYLMIDMHGDGFWITFFFQKKLMEFITSLKEMINEPTNTRLKLTANSWSMTKNNNIISIKVLNNLMDGDRVIVEMAGKVLYISVADSKRLIPILEKSIGDLEKRRY